MADLVVLAGFFAVVFLVTECVLKSGGGVGGS
jgi:hypothetical protein